jgi:hypothetical protein
MTPRAQSAPSPRRGEGGGEGVRAYRETVTPHPNPLPMGEGAHRARVVRVDHYEGWYHKSRRSTSAAVLFPFGSW